MKKNSFSFLYNKIKKNSSKNLKVNKAKNTPPKTFANLFLKRCLIIKIKSNQKIN